MEETLEPWLTVRDITQHLQVHEETVRRWIRTGELSAILLGSSKGGYRVRRTEYDRFLAVTFGATGKAAG